MQQLKQQKTAELLKMGGYYRVDYGDGSFANCYSKEHLEEYLKRNQVLITKVKGKK